MPLAAPGLGALLGACHLGDAPRDRRSCPSPGPHSRSCLTAMWPGGRSMGRRRPVAVRGITPEGDACAPVRTSPGDYTHFSRIAAGHGGPRGPGTGGSAHLTFARAGSDPGVLYAVARGARWSAPRRLTTVRADVRPDLAVSGLRVHIVFRRAGRGGGLFALAGRHLLGHASRARHRSHGCGSRRRPERPRSDPRVRPTARRAARDLRQPGGCERAVGGGARDAGVVARATRTRPSARRRMRLSVMFERR